MTSTIYVAKNIYGGDGLGRLGDGRAVFVSGAWAGEQVVAEIWEQKPNYARARLVEVVEPSPERIAPGPSVPGMVYAALSPAAERESKTGQLGEFFWRARIRIPEIQPPDGSDPVANYRNKVVYHFGRKAGNLAIGYREEPGHKIFDVEDDPLAVPEINAQLPEIRRGVASLLGTGPYQVRRELERKGNATIRWTRKNGVKWWIGNAPEGMVLKETTCGLDFEVPAGGFYQVNPAVAEKLASAVADAYAAGADDAPDVVDLYCGVGTFGLCCVRRAPEAGGTLEGVEGGREAAAFAMRNAASLGVAGAKFHAARVAGVLGRVKIGPRTTVIVDPPRGGLEPGVAKALAGSGAKRIFYVGCDPATMMRDMRDLCRSYKVDAVRWFDMFPRTARFESFVMLSKTGKEGE